MSILIDPLRFPLHGSRLIEASAGTGKTWTIAALYLRLVLGHGGDDGYERALLPSQILVMTFTRAATRELSNRVRERLLEAAAFFRGEAQSRDAYLHALLGAYRTEGERQIAAHRLMLAAETMDEAAIFTIDAWCQRMLREHAFDSACLFDEELISDERTLFEDAAHDYWRQNVYPLNAAALTALLDCWPNVKALKQSVRELVPRAALLGAMGSADEALAAAIARVQREREAQLTHLKEGWIERANEMEQWIARLRNASPKCFDGRKIGADWLAKWFDALRAWAGDANAVKPGLSDKALARLTPDGMIDAFSKDFSAPVPDCFEATAGLMEALNELPELSHCLNAHAAQRIAQRMAQLKQRSGQFGFADMLERLKSALEGDNGQALRARITQQFPVAMVDEFQDTSPDQYRIFDLLYRVAENERAQGLFLIGDPKQSIYGFRGADIHSYLAARSATFGRHYQLGTNYRSSDALVAAVNALFLHAEGMPEHDYPGFAGGAFRFRDGVVNPLPFEAVGAAGKTERFESAHGVEAAMRICCDAHGDMRAGDYRAFFAHHCAEHIATMLNDAQAGFRDGGQFVRLRPADVAVLVRDRREAGAIRQALAYRKIPSVYLSDKDSVIDTPEAGDMLRWLQAVANAHDGALARAAFATRTAGLPLSELVHMLSDELAWESRIEQLKALHLVWQRQGVLAMLRRLIHELKLPAKLLAETGGERSLTNLLHLAELLQAASNGLDGEQALIRWFSEQIEGAGDGGDERVLRLESDAALVKVITVHKSKGLEYPLVYLPFAVTARTVDRRDRSFFEFVEAGERHLDLTLSDQALAKVDAARIEEDLRLLYVALTRARHFLWLGVTTLGTRKAGENKLHESAFGYLLTGGAAVASADLLVRLEALASDTTRIDVLGPAEGATMFIPREQGLALRDAASFSGKFERNWSVGSFTSLARQTSSTVLMAPSRAQEETMLEEQAIAPPNEQQGEQQGEQQRAGEAPWHSFPRGAVPGNFLHEQLEWMGQDGFSMDASFDKRLAERCERAGWGNRQLDAIAWLRAIATTRLAPLDASLSELNAVLPEMEFWFPCEQLSSSAIDRLCADHLLDAMARPALPERQLHGMLKGFADLVFEHEGRYWVLDYKSNALGSGDGAYHKAALAAGMAAHRYDIQGAIYMLALHRLLKSRLGAAYAPERQLGGALFLFLRGIGNTQTRGCYLLAPNLVLLDGIDAALGQAHVAANCEEEGVDER